MADRTRARDADRHAAVDIIEAAYADGQLSHEEFDSRVEQALKASRLSQLDHTVGDIQSRGPLPWRTPAPPEGPVPGERQLGRAALVWAGCAVAVLAVMIGPLLLGSDPPAADPVEEPLPTHTQRPSVPASQLVWIEDPLTSAGLNDFMHEYEERFGDEASATRVVLRRTSVDVVRPGADGKTALAYTWDGVWTGPRSRKGGDQRFEFSTLGYDQISEPLEWARADVGEATDSWVEIRVYNVKGREVCFTAHAVNDETGAKATVATNCDGEVVVRR